VSSKAKKLKITQIKSGIGSNAKQRATLEALKLTRHQKTVIHDDTPQIRGMIFRVNHLIQVEETV
jgi:large subunit ribosomal protein L30